MTADLPVPFTVEAIPGTGAFAVLCLARNARGEQVALKVLKSELAQNAEALTRLRDEARLLLRLDHPNLVGGHDLLVRDGRPVLVMEAVRGVPLDTLLRENRDGVEPELAAEIILQTCRGLAALWSSPNPDDGQPMRIVHRDIKPENLMIAVDGTVRIIDFGTATARVAGLEARDEGQVTGTRGYMGPERMAGAPDTPSGDVYALGVTLFQLLTGKQMVVSMAEGRHDDTVFKLLDRVTSDTLDDEQLRVLRHLVRRMCLFEAELRPSPDTIVSDVERMLGEIPNALPVWAEENVQPKVDAAAAAADPRSHVEWRQVSFLEQPESWSSWRSPTATQDECDAALVAFLSQKDWTGRVEELQLLLIERPRWTAAPFVAIVERALRPKWQFWNSRPSHEQLAIAVQFLRQRADEPVVELITQLTEYPDQQVRDAVAAMLRMVE